MEKTFAITKGNPALGITTNKTDNTFTYGETITFTANVSIPTTKGRAVAVNTVEFFCNGTSLGTANLTESGGTGTASFTYNTTGKKIPAGVQTITAQYGGSGNLNGQTGTVNVTLNKKPLTATLTGGATTTKVYDGTNSFTNVALTIGTGEVLSGDTVTATANGDADNANADTNKAFTATSISLSDTYADYYSLANNAVTGNVEITPATPEITVTAEKKVSFLRSIIGSHNDTITLTVTTKGVNGEKPEGNVEFKNGGNIIYKTSTEDGVATYEWANPPASSYTITAEFTASDSNYIYTAVTGTAAFEIEKAEQKWFYIQDIGQKTYGDKPFTLYTEGDEGTGAVTYTSDNSMLTIQGDQATIVGASTAYVTITATKAEDNNYKEATATTMLSIRPATPTITWGNTTQTVNFTGAEVEIPTPPTVTGVSGGTNPDGVISYQYKSTAARLTNLFGLLEGYTDGLPINAGEYKIVATIAESGNYGEAQSSEMTLTIQKITSTLDINSMEGKTYDGTAIADPTDIISNITNPTVAYTYYKDNGNAKGEQLSSAPKDAGNYWVEGTIAETGNTTEVTSAAVKFTINQAPLTVTGGIVTEKKWDNNTSATVTALTFDGLQNSETLTISTDYTVGSPTFDSVAVGNDKTVTGTATLVENAKTKNYSLTGTFVNVKGNITLADGPAAPTNGVVNDTKGTDTFAFAVVSGIADITKYEYSLNSGADWTDVSVNPIAIGNIAVPVGALQVRVKATATHNAGEILSNESAFTASIEGIASITGTAAYGETLTATATGTQAGAELHYLWKAGSETVGTDGSTYTLEGKAVGKTITVEVTATNYNGELTSAATTAVAKKAVTATAGTISKVYDGTTAVETADQALSITKVNASDDITVAMLSATYNSADVGTGKAITVGALTITGAAKDWYDVTAPSSVTGEISKKSLTSATVEVSGTYTYTGAAQTPTAANITVKDGLDNVDAANYDIALSNNTNAGQATVNVTFKGNYSGTASGSFTISPKAITPTIETIAAQDYDGTAKVPTLTVKDGSTTLTSGTDYDAVYSDNINAGTAKVAVTLKGNYSGSAKATFTINKTNYTGTAITGNKFVIQDTAATGVQFDLASLSFPAGFKDKTFESVVIGTNTDKLITGTPSISGTKVVFDVASLVAGKTGILNVTVRSTNYNDYTVAITITTVDKTPVTITGLTAATNLSYNGLPQNGYTGTLSVEGNKVPTSELVYHYMSTDGAGFTGTTPPTNAGAYKLVVSVADSNASYIGNHADVLFTIDKKAVTVKADNQTMVKNGTIPAFTVTYTGFVGTENDGNAALATAAVASCSADGKTVGTFDITLSTQAVLNGTIGKNYNITEQNKGTLIVSEITHSITASAGTGGTISPSGAITVTDGTTQTFTISANSGYRIADVTVDGTSQGVISSYTFSNVTGNHTISATFSSTGGGGGGSTGGGGGGGGSTPTPTPPVITEPNLPTQGEIKVTPKVDKDGNATLTASEKDVVNAIKKAQDDAKKNGTEKNGISVVIEVNSNKNLNSVTTTLTQEVLKQLTDAKVNSLTIKSNSGIITFDLTALTYLYTTAGTAVTVSATKVDSSKLSAEAQKATGGRPIYDFKVMSGNTSITTFGNGKISIGIPYELQKVDGNGTPSKTGTFENPGNLVGVYIDANGKLTYLAGTSYHAASKTMLINTTHLSMYGVAYKTSTPTFTDTANHWAKEDIQFVAARGLLTGTGNSQFRPDGSMTRAMFVTALGRLANADVSGYKTSSFNDVAAGSYYLGYVEWAVKNNITNGVGDGKFAPDKSISRQEMAVMLQSYAKAIGYKLPSVHKEIVFTDNASIGTWAKTAVKEMQMAGILMGKDGGKFDPTGTATRAEVSAMLRRFVELVANSETAEGWVQNDSGNWMYFENGKAATGKKKIDGTTYEFDQYGITALPPKDRRYTLYTVQKGDSFWAIAAKHKVNIFELASLNGKTIFSIIHPGDELKIPQK